MSSREVIIMEKLYIFLLLTTVAVVVSAQSAEDYWTAYHTHDEILDFIDRKAADCGDRCQVMSIGQSLEGRDLKFIKISSSDASTSNKTRVWIDGGIHAREWIAPATVTYFIERLVDDFETDPAVQRILDAFDWYILPVLNPDGYAYTWESNRLWRKSRNQWTNTSCIGVDVNRNYPHEWMTVGASPWACSSTFAGYYPLSEPESKQQVEYMQAHPNVWEIFLTVHSYGQYWLLPYGYTIQRPDNYDEMMYAGQIAVDAIEAVHGKHFILGTAAEVLYQTSGSSDDWAHGVLGIPYVYTPELRDTGAWGFELPPDQILPAGEETWAGVRALADYVAGKQKRD